MEKCLLCEWGLTLHNTDSVVSNFFCNFWCFFIVNWILKWKSAAVRRNNPLLPLGSPLVLGTSLYGPYIINRGPSWGRIWILSMWIEQKKKNIGNRFLCCLFLCALWALLDGGAFMYSAGYFQVSHYFQGHPAPFTCLSKIWSSICQWVCEQS